MSETRARRRIRQAVESRGYKLVTLDYEPCYDAGEKSGLGGGWYGTLDRDYLPNTWPGNDIMGLSVDEVLCWIDEFVAPPEPCDCPEAPSSRVSWGPTWQHVEACRWRINYWLRWWPKEAEARREP